ncbi:MAG: hypothetical protein GWM98_30140, partial [Nitrospinaceae bacterium]|nr:hypothetical protein [Nitrospinaceae bacterium]NIR57947.1 hypothetical protein [Nitrospinaceae bacterium]NIS88412.1 hypothetical protein [Nitrospinaceae bacterium]NIT85285.1 hypothetical protein [Nitrospinaceae bacterium]NIU47443.1 hypothetical protein [Nitrospinaceae bacterium]
MIAHTKHGFAVGECALPSAVLLGATYFIAGWLGTQWALPPGYATAVFPASGIALAGILGWGYRVWPGILLGSL